MTIRIFCSSTLIVCLSIGLFGTDIVSSSFSAQKSSDAELQQNLPRTIDGEITNIVNVPGYTYVEVDTGKNKAWAAVPSTSVNIGDKVSFSSATPMENFYSKTLKRDFAVIYFVDRFITEGGITTMSAAAVAAHGKLNQEPATEPVKDINKVEGGNTIAEIHARKDELTGETIRVRGQVTRFTADVLGKNWVHIRDSSAASDLTITTHETVAINDVVIIEGELELNRDYGYGYVYPVILQDARITKE